MGMSRMLRNAAAAVAVATLVACGPEGPPQTSAVRSVAEQQAGDQASAQIVARFGGEYRDAELQAYVERIGRRLAAASEQPDAQWTFTVLDSPTVNAFALPGGYVYVTRGMLALANSEAEIAGVMGHEIGHVTAGHSMSRQTRTTAAGIGMLLGSVGLAALGIDPSLSGGLLQAAAGGALATYSRQDELAADYLGIRYMSQAGYDPLAQADILESLSRASELEAQIAGRGYDPDRVDFMASHPANAPRTRQAIETARAQGDISLQGSERGRESYLAAIDGMTWGPSPEQGYVADTNRFIHPVLDFTFSVPNGWQITNAPAAVTAAGPEGAQLIFEGGGDVSGSLTDFISGTWAPALARQAQQVGQLQSLESTRINGLEAARGVLPMAVNNRRVDTLLVAVRHPGGVYRFTGLAPQGSGALNQLAAAANSFRTLTPQERATAEVRRLQIVTVRPGDTIESFVRQMRVDEAALDRFLVLNRLDRSAALEPGQQVKIIR